jgi:type I restriction enzyme, S subunit
MSGKNRRETVPAGDKMTEVGVIPEDWGVVSLGSTATVTTGRKDVNEGSPTGRYPFFTCSVGTAASDSWSFDGEAILVAGNGDVGTLHFYSGRFEAYQRTYVIQQFGECVSYVWQQMRYRLKRSLGIGTIGSSIPYIKKGDLTSFLIPTPLLQEQRAIAEALSDVDNLLDALDRLIAKKRAVKQAAMQQLLTGKTRLPGFAGEWEEATLGAIGTFSKGAGISRNEVVSEGLPCVRYGEIYTHHDDVIRTFYSFISDDTASRSARLKRGDLLFAGSGETREEIGKCVGFDLDVEAYAGGDTVILSQNNHEVRFLGYLLNTPEINVQKAQMGQGDAVVHIAARSLAQVAVQLPPLPEQRAIAEVLSDMDDEIAALEKRRDKTRRIKEGMMQQLLTGRVRLVAPADIHDEGATQ